jgi:hypothetical protein
MMLERFAIACDEDARHFFIVEVHPTRLEMLEAIRQLAKQRTGQDTCALCLSYLASYEALPGREELGTLFFSREDFTPEVVAHELTHAALAWARRRRINPLKRSRGNRVTGAEERFATLVQSLTRQVYQKVGHKLVAGMLAEAA